MRECFDFLGRKTWGEARAPQPLPKQRLCCGRLIEVTEQKRFYLHWQLAAEYTQSGLEYLLCTWKNRKFRLENGNGSRHFLEGFRKYRL